MREKNPVTRCKFIAVLLIAAACIITAGAVNPYPTLKAKAERFFDHQEWASASAMFDLMLEEHPDVPGTYGQAIVANGMLGESAGQNRLMTMALDNHIPFDSVFSNVKEWSFHIGQPVLFEEFLKNTRTAHPWMRRTIDGQLLKYYAFRRNGTEMIAYSNIMLAGAPDNIEFLTLLVEGYMLTGDNAKGLDTYRRILALDPDNYNALLVIGNWYAQHPANGGNGLPYLQRADSIRPTPYVTALIGKLQRP